MNSPPLKRIELIDKYIGLNFKGVIMELKRAFIFPRRKLSKMSGIPPSTLYYRLLKLEKKKELGIWRNGRKALIFESKDEIFI